MTMECPCGSGLAYEACCQPIITGATVAPTAEALMRARYSAYTQVELEFLNESLHPDSREDSDPEGARDWAENSTWHGLEIVGTTRGGAEHDEGEVEFVATYTHQGREQVYHEIASFERVEGRWTFKEGRPGVRKPTVREEPKIGRNDPCSCGSGRKFKKCCGA
ncbi:YchJ family protein [bacterium]|nr:YchJ family protein [bacterium]